MYKIIGADNKEYGPVTLDQMRQWVREGRVNFQTKVQSETGPDWKEARDFPEISELFPAAPGVPPVMSARPPVEGKMSGMAIASLVLGVLGWVTLGLGSLLGLILGIVAMVRIGRSRGALRGNGVALAGTIVSGTFLLIVPILAAMLLPALAKAKAKAQGIYCMNNLKQLGLGTIMYANDHQNLLPAGTNWSSAVVKYVGSERVFVCPADRHAKKCAYAFNVNLSGIDLKEVRSPSDTVLIFESDGDWNATGGPEMVLTSPRHIRAVGLVFADGHAELASPSRIDRLRWEP
jgi:hypothetical protein